MKKIKYLLFTLVLFLCCMKVNAASLSVSANKSTVVVGSTVSVTVSASGAAGWEYCLSYDESLFSLTGAGSDTGGKCVLTGSTLTGYSKVTFTLKAKKSGTGTVTVTNASMYGDDGLAVSTSKGSVKLVCKTQAEIEASYSTNANLKSLGVANYTISPEFDKDTLEYSLEVENEVESVVIEAQKADNTASVSGTGEVSLLEGSNTFNVVVTAQKGNTKKYTIVINRKELNPIEVKTDGKDLFVVRKTDGVEPPSYYAPTTAMMGDEEIPVYKSEISGYTLIALKDGEGNYKFYIWDQKNNTYKLYRQLNTSGLIIIAEEPDSLLKIYNEKKNIKYGDNEITVYYNKHLDNVVFYGMNAATGKKDWYSIDKRDNIQLVDGAILRLDKNLNKYLLIAGGVLLLLLIIFIILLCRIKSVKKKNKKMYELLTSSKNEEQPKEEVKEKEIKKKKEVVKEEVKKRVKPEKPVETPSTKDIQEKKESKEEKSIKEIEESEEKELSKRELRKVEKEKLRKEREELKKMQEDFDE